jgi:tRNA G18 (ribose-2'-O)-methylase SpoU
MVTTTTTRDDAMTTKDDATVTPRASERAEMYFLAHNVAKKHNIGTMARCCTAFGVKSLVLIGSRQFNTFGSHGADGYVHFEHFDSLSAARETLKGERGCTQILGVEIVDDARAIESHPFTGNTAFIMGNEGHGMTEAQKAICDGFVYIPQYGPGTASLNVSVAASIVMHHFALWAGYEERSREGEKFVVAERPHRTRKRGEVSESPEQVRARRAAARALNKEETDKDAAISETDIHT